MALHDKETLFDLAYKGDIETIKLKFKDSKNIITNKDEVSFIILTESLCLLPQFLNFPILV